MSSDVITQLIHERDAALMELSQAGAELEAEKARHIETCHAGMERVSEVIDRAEAAEKSVKESDAQVADYAGRLGMLDGVVAELREENARLKAEDERTTEYLREMLRRVDAARAALAAMTNERDRYRTETSATKALLGRAVAVLRGIYGRLQRVAGPGFLDNVDAILADATATQAAESWRAAVAYAGALAQADCGEGKPSDLDVYRERFENAFAALAKVDARRGGGR